MRRTNIMTALATGALLAAVALSTQAQNAQDFGDYVVHYNALTTDFLTPQVAKHYGISRSKNRGMLNVSVLSKSMGVPNRSVKAEVSAEAKNLNAQVKPMNLREISEGNAVYYIAEFPISDRETLDFKIDVTPEGGGGPMSVSFRQQFYTR
ncbi:MAG: DUF4426 domain-containing protein [Chromatiales bacterium]